MRKEPVYHQDCEDESVRLTKEDKKMLIELICDEQTRMIVKDHTKYLLMTKIIDTTGVDDD